MKTAAIICEYNPFHNGHKYHIEQTRLQHGATHIVCVMSGNFTQRGDVALSDKYARARAALMGGADLVVELPTRLHCRVQSILLWGLAVLPILSVVSIC